MFYLFRSFLIFSLLVIGGKPWASTTEKVKQSVLKQDYRSAKKELIALKEKKEGSLTQGVQAFAQGVLDFELAEPEFGKDYFLAALKHNLPFPAYAHYYLGLIEKMAGNWKLARKNLSQALGMQPTQKLRFQIRYALGDIALAEKRYSKAYKHFRYLQRRWKSAPEYPTILKGLVEADLSRRKHWRACRWARNLYRNFPASQETQGWGMDLQQVEIAGKKLSCLASFKDKQRRIQRLQWAGESQKARSEIEALVARSTKATRYSVDRLLANFLIQEGFAREALHVLLKYHKQYQKNFDYQMLIGKAAARGGEYQSAVGAYYKAHAMTSRRSSKGRKALFRAAFLSYQFQDYDGALRKFMRFLKRYPGSSLSRDVRWHLAWLKYLKGDYDGAIDSFRRVYKMAKRRRWRWRKYPLDKIKYWLAMSYFRKGNYGEARDHLISLYKAAPYSYYGQAARTRLGELPEGNPNQIRGLASAELEAVDTPEELSSETPDKIEVADDSESEETVMEDKQDDLAENEIPVGNSEPDDRDEKDEDLHAFTSSKFQTRFENATIFISLGFYDWARQELFAIERRARKKEHHLALIKAYEDIGAYHRSAYVAQVHFSKARHRGGITGATELWQKAYPMAYSGSVQGYSGKFGVSKDFIWGLMRAESRYRVDANSPVGAKGLMQIMPNTGRQVSRLMGHSQFDPSQLTEFDTNIKLGTRYLQRLSKMFRGQLPLIAAGYNAGPHRVTSWLASFGYRDMDEFIEHIPFVETRKYVKKVTRNYGIYQALYSDSSGPIAWLKLPVEIPTGIRHKSRESWDRLPASSM